MFQLISIITSIAGFTHKLLLVNNKKTGWFFGFISGLLFTIYFYSTNLYILSTSSLSFTILCLYGFLSNANNKHKYTEVFIRTTTIIACIVLTYATFTGVLSIVQFIASMSQVIGAYFLTHQSERYGWSCFLIAHCIIAYLNYKIGQFFFADFQIASAIIAILGIVKSFQTKSAN